MKLITTAVMTGNRIETVDTVEYAGWLWLVPLWADSPDGKLTMPMRLVCLSLLPHEKTDGSQHDYVLKTPIPKEIFDYDAPLPAGKGLLVVDPLRLQMSKNRPAH